MAAFTGWRRAKVQIDLATALFGRQQISKALELTQTVTAALEQEDTNHIWVAIANNYG